MRTMTNLTLHPRDPIIARDGRPFGKGQNMYSLDWIYPSVVAGSLRTMLGKIQGWEFDEAQINTLKEIRLVGPFPIAFNQPYFPRPMDIVIRVNKDNREVHPARPSDFNEGEGWDLEESELRPVTIPGEGEDFKPAPVPTFWSQKKVVNWLTDSTGMAFEAPPDPDKLEGEADFLRGPQKDKRVHVKINTDTRTAEDKCLFSSVGLALSTPLIARVSLG